MPHIGCVVFRFSGFGERNILSCNVTVQDGLIERIAALDFYVVDFVCKAWGANQRKNEVIQVFLVMRLWHRNYFIPVESSEDALDGGFR